MSESSRRPVPETCPICRETYEEANMATHIRENHE